MNSNKKSIIIGFLWGILSIIPYSYINNSDLFIKKVFLILAGLPTYIAIALGFHFSLVFIAAPIVGIIITLLYSKCFIKK